MVDESGSSGIPWNPHVQFGQFVDPRDRREYRTIRVGEQVWLAENLATSPSESRCYEEEMMNLGRFGCLYDWYTARSICPRGWHLPTDAEWMELELSLGMGPGLVAQTGWRATCEEGNHLKSARGWSTSQGTDSVGFRAVPAGMRDAEGEWEGLGRYAHFWTASEYGSDRAWRRFVHGGSGAIARYPIDRYCAMSIRCVQDRV
ncbi:MAG TPA: FISUMP domain-containing protein, partial [Fibrobacteria bacterium]|nr:FISUMP domain-containing protein [Fibrobacteria bacterium]